MTNVMHNVLNDIPVFGQVSKECYGADSLNVDDKQCCQNNIMLLFFFAFY